jgi:hypothetical protein
MKHIGFLSFGHWTPPSQSQTRSVNALLRSTGPAAEAPAAARRVEFFHSAS